MKEEKKNNFKNKNRENQRIIVMKKVKRKKRNPMKRITIVRMNVK